MGASALMDYYVHEWAGDNKKGFINVGHTRPFPLDGIFFNKRKWMMSLISDYDGVMDMAVKICRNDNEINKALQTYPFVYHSKTGFNMFCMCIESKKAGLDNVQPLWRRFWTEGIENFNVISPTGYEDTVRERAEKMYGARLRLFESIKEVLAFQNGQR